MPALLATLESFFHSDVAVEPGGRLVIAFSGGGDSTALLWGLRQLAPQLGISLVAAHLDHGLDPGSAGRAREAARLAAKLAVPLIAARREMTRKRGESLEAAARRVRYRFLEEVRTAAGARYVATAHHRDDQSETVLLRLLSGTGWAGVASIRPRHGSVVRPLLTLPRAALVAALAEADLLPIDDPTNRELAPLRNRIRHQLLPALRRLDSPADAGPTPGPLAFLASPDSLGAPNSLDARLSRLADRARAAADAVDRRLLDLLAPEPFPGAATGVRIDRALFASLPSPVRTVALAALHRAAGAPYPASEAAAAELSRQLGRGGAIVCDCGGGWRWEGSAAHLAIRRGKSEETRSEFTYTLEVPGVLAIPELAVRMRLRRGPVEPWMFRGAIDRVGLALPLEDGERVTVRTRRPGDRIHPLGARGGRRLKEVLIDRRMPKRERERLPLLCLEDRIAWVPGVTIDQGFRISSETTAWIAEILTP